MIPDFIDIGAPWKVLPPGVHSATLEEVEARFVITEHRKKLFAGFKRGAINLQKAGCQTIYLDGSFITEKPVPKDYDVCWDPVNVNGRKVDKTLLTFANKREEQKKVYYGEFFPSSVQADGANTFLDFFKKDKYTDKAKGIIKIRL